MTKRPKFTTPVGVLGFPCSIHIPDSKFADDKDENDKGEFKARIRLPEGEASTIEFIAMLQDLYDSHVEEVKRTQKKKKLKFSDENLPWGPEVHYETGEETGNILVRTKLRARVVSKDESFFDQRPKVFKPNGVLLTGEDVPAIGAGSTVKLAGQVHLWYTALGAGMSLWLSAVQLIELVEWEGGSNNAEDYGFAVNPDDDGEFAEAGTAEASDGDY